MNFVYCTDDRHAPEILMILNEAIVNSTALYEYQPRTLEDMAVKETGSFPVIGVLSENNQLMGFAHHRKNSTSLLA
jgi:L-amino acid N-acyltransferase YncA